MREWWICYRMGYSDYDEVNVVVMPNIPKLILWIARYGSRCTEASIRLVEG